MDKQNEMMDCYNNLPIEYRWSGNEILVITVKNSRDQEFMEKAVQLARERGLSSNTKVVYVKYDNPDLFVGWKKWEKTLMWNLK